MSIGVILFTGQGRSRKVMEGHFLLHGYATHDLVFFSYAGSDGHGNIYTKLTLLIISVYLKHTKSFIPYATQSGPRKNVIFSCFYFVHKTALLLTTFFPGI